MPANGSRCSDDATPEHDGRYESHDDDGRHESNGYDAGHESNDDKSADAAATTTDPDDTNTPTWWQGGSVSLATKACHAR